MKTVFILGAGASKYAGAPLMNDFFDYAEEIKRRERIDSFEEVFEALGYLKIVHSNASLNLDNLETVFEAIEMGMIIGGFGDRTEKEMEDLRSSLKDLIVKTLEKKTKFPVIKGRVYPPHAHRELSYFIKQIAQKKQLKRNSFSFITFNYDIILDYTLPFMQIPFNYSFNESDSPEKEENKIPLLKLHGSLNWGECKKCNRITSLPLNQSEFKYFSDKPEYARLEIGSKILKEKCPYCKNELYDPPVIVPPTWNKTSFHYKIDIVWKKAADVLKEAEHIFIIGYSLPETDMFFKYLFALGTIRGARIKNIVVVNPDKDQKVKEKFSSFIGDGIKNKLIFYNENEGDFSCRDSKLEKGLEKIKSKLEDIYKISLKWAPI